MRILLIPFSVLILEDSTRISINKNIANYTKQLRNPLYVYKFIIDNVRTSKGVEWIPYSQIGNLEKIAEGGFGIVHKATWQYETVAIKSNSYFSLKSHYYTPDIYNSNVIDCRGITQDPVTKDYMIIMTYANSGILHDCLQKKFINITWIKKVFVLVDISKGPFSNVEHNVDLIYEIIDGKQPNITNDTLKCFANLMRRCWNLDPLKRPNIFAFQGLKLGPEFSQGSRPFTSKTSSLISELSTINSFTMILHSNAIYISRQLSKLISTVNSLGKRNIKKLKTEIQDNGRGQKCLKE
ncbi:kinase-like domain-containing protein [Rhizophagus clarus]|uniref:Kinase-like domain-containing protein n=1 Tax=Rhizophagus clarus TaxID=94130 RepID=A0A8H3L9M0_9GLOM|nr:kinase-like domain-containing protein [Rhizophagus clarus]